MQFWTCVFSYWIAWSSQHYPGLLTPARSALTADVLTVGCSRLGRTSALCVCAAYHNRCVFFFSLFFCVKLVYLIPQSWLSIVAVTSCRLCPLLMPKGQITPAFPISVAPPCSPHPWGFWVISLNNMAEATPHSAAVMSIYLLRNPPPHPTMERGQCESNFSLKLLNMAGARLFEHSSVCLLMRETTPLARHG